MRRLREEEKLGPAAIAKRLKIGRASVYRLLATKPGATAVTAAPSREELEAMAAALEASGEYKVLRKLAAEAPLPSPACRRQAGLGAGRGDHRLRRPPP